MDPTAVSLETWISNRILRSSECLLSYVVALLILL